MVMLGTTVCGARTAPSRITAASRTMVKAPWVRRETYQHTICADLDMAADLRRLDYGPCADRDVVAEAQRKVGKETGSGARRTLCRSCAAGAAPRARRRVRSAPWQSRRHSRARRRRRVPCAANRRAESHGARRCTFRRAQCWTRHRSRHAARAHCRSQPSGYSRVGWGACVGRPWVCVPRSRSGARGAMCFVGRGLGLVSVPRSVHSGCDRLATVSRRSPCAFGPCHWPRRQGPLSTPHSTSTASKIYSRETRSGRSASPHRCTTSAKRR